MRINDPIQILDNKLDLSNNGENSLTNSLFLVSVFIIISVKFYLVFLNPVHKGHLYNALLFSRQYQIHVLMGIVC